MLQLYAYQMHLVRYIDTMKYYGGCFTGITDYEILDHFVRGLKPMVHKILKDNPLTFADA